MTNHSQKLIKDQLDLTSRVITQTADGSFVGQNTLTNLEVGDILIHAPNAPLTRVDNKADISSLQAFGKQWEVLAQEIANTPDSLRGDAAPSGTAWRQVQALQQESHSLFELMVENKGLDIEKMMRTYVLPYLKKQMDTSDEISATLSSYHINKVDSMYIPNEAIRRYNEKSIKTILDGGVAEPFNAQAGQEQVQKEVSQQGSQRFFKPSDIDDKTWKEVFSDLEWEVEVDVTGEGQPDKEDMATLSTVLQTIATNPRVLSDPNAKLIFNKILSVAGGVSPLELVDSQPFIPMPTKKLTETMDYKDVPDDVKRQIEQQAGLQPSQQSNQQTNPAGQAQPAVQGK